MTPFEDDHPPIDPLSNRHGNAYADMGESVSMTASIVLESLSKPFREASLDEGGWHYFEGDALAAYVDMELHIPHIRATDEVSPHEMEVFTGYLATFRSALPFSEAERHWLWKQREVGANPHHFEAELSHAGDEPVISAGQHIRLDGQDMLRRWRSWRRETDEYAGQGTLDVARDALRGMLELLSPWEPLPEAYRKLRGLPEPGQE